jgi:hypothetical protein
MACTLHVHGQHQGKWVASISGTYNHYTWPRIFQWTPSRGHQNYGVSLACAYTPRKIEYSLALGRNNQQVHYAYYDRRPTFIETREVNHTFAFAEGKISIPLKTMGSHSIWLTQGFQVNKYLKSTFQNLYQNGRMNPEKAYDVDTLNLQYGPMLGLKCQFRIKKIEISASAQAITMVNRTNKPAGFYAPEFYYPSYFNIRTGISLGYIF